MEAMLTAVSDGVELMLSAIICVGLLLGLLLHIQNAVHHLGTWTQGRVTIQRAAWAYMLPVLMLGALVGASVAFPAPTAAAQGWWWGSPITPGFDPQTVIQVTGTAAQVEIGGRGGPSTLRLENSQESFTVMLGPGWFLAELKTDIQSGDSLTVEGSKMMDRRQQVHLVAARITNHRTGSVVVLRDEKGHPCWMGGPGPGRKS
jgi:hypothetical protein